MTMEGRVKARGENSGYFQKGGCSERENEITGPHGEKEELQSSPHLTCVNVEIAVKGF